jgi:hypothetical protein
MRHRGHKKAIVAVRHNRIMRRCDSVGTTLAIGGSKMIVWKVP